MASPSLVKQWQGASPMSEPRRSPRLSGAHEGILKPTSANRDSSARSRRSSLMVGGKRSLKAQASPGADEDELPEEMQFASDSPAPKKQRPSEAKRNSRVSFGLACVREFDKNQSRATSAGASRRSSVEKIDHPTEVSTVTEASESDMSVSSNEGFYDCEESDDDATGSVPVQTLKGSQFSSLKGLLDSEQTETRGYTNLSTNFNTGEETAPTPQLSKLGDFDDTENFQPRTSSTGGRPSSTGGRVSMAADNTALIAANMLSRPSMAPHAMGLVDTPTSTGPSLANLVKRAQGQLDESQATGSIQDTSSPDTSADDLDGSMEMTECYGGGIVQTVQSSPARAPSLSPNLAAASMTTLNVKPPESPLLKKVMRERESASASKHQTTALASPAPAGGRRESSIGLMIPKNMNVSPIASNAPKQARMSTTPQAMNRRKGASVLAATEDIAPTSPVSDKSPVQQASPAMLRAGSRITMTASGTEPSPNPPQSPCRPSPMKVSPAQPARSMPLLDSNEEDTSTGAAILTADQHADKVLGGFEGEEQEESFEMPDHAPETETASPVRQAQVSEFLSKELKRRSMAHAGQIVPIQPADTTRSSSSKVICNSWKHFCQLADIGFVENMSVNRRDTLCIRPGAAKAHDYDLRQAIVLSTTALPELRVMQGACDDLTDKIAVSQAEIGNAEKAAELNPPALFAELANDTRGEVATVIRGKLKTLKQTCRKQAKLAWYEWFSNTIGQVHQENQGEIDRLMKEESDLVNRTADYENRTQNLCDYMSTLGLQLDSRTNTELDEANELEKATAEKQQEVARLDEQRAKLREGCAALQKRKDALELSVEGLNSQKGYLMGESNGTAPATLEDVTHAQKTYHAQLDIEGVVLRSDLRKCNEMVVDLCEAHRVTLRMEGGKIVEAQLKLFEAESATSHGEVDDLWRGLGTQTA